MPGSRPVITPPPSDARPRRPHRRVRRVSELVEALRARRGGGRRRPAGCAGRSTPRTPRIYRVEPQVVVTPRDVDEVLATPASAASCGVPLTMRGAGTSIAGNAVGPGVVVDFCRHLQPGARDRPRGAAPRVVQPGVVQAALQRAAAPHGLRFGPDPSTHNRATLGGMIGNNACGSRALGYGRTSDNVLALDVVDRARASGCGSARGRRRRRVVAGLHATSPRGRGEPGHDPHRVRPLRPPGLRATPWSTCCPRTASDVARALVGTEGTLARRCSRRDGPAGRATRRCACSSCSATPTWPRPPTPSPPLLAHGRWRVRGHGRPDRRRGRAPAAGRRRAAAAPRRRLAVRRARAARRRRGRWPGAAAGGRDAGALDAVVVTDPAQAAALWRIREDGAGLAGRTPTATRPTPGWEDAAVPPERLGAYLREFDALMAEHGAGRPALRALRRRLRARPDRLPVRPPRRQPRFRAFLRTPPRLVAAHGGSMSGEHGDGRARGELLPLMYSPAAHRPVRRREGGLRPGRPAQPRACIVRPAPLDADLRVPRAPGRADGLALAYRHDRGDLSPRGAPLRRGGQVPGRHDRRPAG